MSIKNGTTLTPEALSYLVGLIRDISGLDTKLIDDINLKTNGSWSSVHTKNMIDQNLIDSKAYVDKLIGALNKLSSKKTTVQPTLDNSEFNVIYLYSSSGSAPFDQYLKIGTNDSDAELVSLGSTNIDLTDYLKITDADSTYCKKTDFDTLKTALTTHTGDTDIHITSDERNKWNEVDLKVNDEVVKKTDIVKSVDKTSNDNTIPSAYAVYNKSKNKIKQLSNGEDIIAYADTITNESVTDTVKVMNATNSPYGVSNTDSDFYYTIYNVLDYNFKRIVAYDIRKNDMYMLIKSSGKWGTWRRVCTWDDKDILITSDERTKWNNKIDRASITTTVDGNSTDTQVPSARAVYDNSLTKGIGEGNTIIPDGADLNDYLIPGVYTCFSSVSAETLSNCPHKESNFKLFVNKNTGETTGFYGYQMIVGSKFSTILKPCVYYRSVSGDKSNPTYSKWQRVCITSVADVPWTELTLDSGMSGSISYRVKNGICYVNVDVLRSSTMSTNNQTIVTGLPVPEVNAWYSLISSSPSQGGLLVNINSAGRMVCNIGLDNASYFGTFSYPVAES